MEWVDWAFVASRTVPIVIPQSLLLNNKHNNNIFYWHDNHYYSWGRQEDNKDIWHNILFWSFHTSTLKRLWYKNGASSYYYARGSNDNTIQAISKNQEMPDHAKFRTGRLQLVNVLPHQGGPAMAYQYGLVLHTTEWMDCILKFWFVKMGLRIAVIFFVELVGRTAAGQRWRTDPFNHIRCLCTESAIQME